jgi:CRP-like cAMP-binding protein
LRNQIRFAVKEPIVAKPVVRREQTHLSDVRDEKTISNLILRGLPKKELAEVFPSLEFVRLKLNQVLHETGEVIKSTYFMESGLASVLAVQPNGKSVEVGLIGKEGFVGLPAIFGLRTSALRVVVQGDGAAYRVEVATLQKFLPRCAELERQLQTFSMIFGTQSAQIAACNRLHEVEERLARWLLMSHDRMESEILPLTQEFLGQMLGTRRSSVSVAAAILQKAGMIGYTRGRVTILDRTKLEKTACDCYVAINRQAGNWREEAQSNA